MNKRPGVLKNVFDVIARILFKDIFYTIAIVEILVIFVPGLPPFYPVLMIFTMQGAMFFSGIESIQKAKAQGREAPWWKERGIIVSLATLIITVPPTIIFYMSYEKKDFFPIFSLFILAIVIYSLILVVRQRKRSTSTAQEKREKEL